MLSESETDIKSMTLHELSQVFKSMGEPEYRGTQVFSWLHKRMVSSYDEMTDLSKPLRARMREDYPLTVSKILDCMESKDGSCKYLLEYADGESVECVSLRYNKGISVCVSTQAGCRMGCKFCASGMDGLSRNLTAAEILEQVYAVTRHEGVRISNIVIMGTGEPLDNYDNVIRFIRLISAPEGQNISVRNITLSTCGIVEGIRKLAAEGLPVTLALSLHGATDAVRRRLMPVANAYHLEDVLDACRDYSGQSGRRLTLEYTLVAGINDSDEDARLLAAVGRSCGAHINLIPVNAVPELGFVPPCENRVYAFKRTLEGHQANVTLRRRLGSDVNGACGQLRHKRYNS